MPLGRLESINTSRGGVPKLSVFEALVTKDGLAGDRQSDLRYHGGPNRAVVLFSLELIRALQQEGQPAPLRHRTLKKSRLCETEHPRLLPSPVVFFACLLVPALVAAQTSGAPPSGPETSSLLAAAPSSKTDRPSLDLGFDGSRFALQREERECAGCPKRNLAIPYLESIGLNILYNAGNRLRGHETADIGPSSWWANMKHGFEWDANPFGVNQMGHPYQGNNYFTAGRANGLSFWEASSVAAFGSATWEFYFENNRASLNDLVNTTLGGIALGEMLYRAAWLVRDTTATGRSRKIREIVATAIDPMTGMTRFISGDASRVVEVPPAMIPSSTSVFASAGVLYQGANLREVSSAARPFLDFDVVYGDVLTGRSRTPYEAFALRFALGGGSVMSESIVRGRLLGQPIGGRERYQFTLFQTFDYTVNRAYVFGAQGFEADVAMTQQMSSRWSLRLSASGGLNALAAVDSLVPAPPGSGASPAEIADAPRKYDYGPGARVGGTARFLVDDLAVANLSYQGYQVSVVDGFRATHMVQRLRLELQCPLPEQLVIGASAEYFVRKAYYWAAPERTDQSPQFRVFLAWRR